MTAKGSGNAYNVESAQRDTKLPVIARTARSVAISCIM